MPGMLLLLYTALQKQAVLKPLPSPDPQAPLHTVPGPPVHHRYPVFESHFLLLLQDPCPVPDMQQFPEKYRLPHIKSAFSTYRSFYKIFSSFLSYIHLPYNGISRIFFARNTAPTYIPRHAVIKIRPSQVSYIT